MRLLTSRAPALPHLLNPTAVRTNSLQYRLYIDPKNYRINNRSASSSSCRDPSYRPSRVLETPKSPNASTARLSSSTPKGALHTSSSTINHNPQQLRQQQFNRSSQQFSKFSKTTFKGRDSIPLIIQDQTILPISRNGLNTSSIRFISSSTTPLLAQTTNDNIVNNLSSEITSESSNDNNSNNNKPLKETTEISSSDNSDNSESSFAARYQDMNSGSRIFSRPPWSNDNQRSPTIELSPKEHGIIRILDRVAKNYESMTGQRIHIRVAGGWVRDKLLGLYSNDIDIAVDKMMGHDFATLVHEFQASKGFKMRPISKIEANPDKSKYLETAIMSVMGVSIDVANLRTDVLDDTDRFLNEPVFGTPYEDAHYRDFTINSLFYNIRTNSVEDFTGRGLEDIRNGLIRTPLNAMDTFWQDPVRVLRCLRFAARFQFKIASDAVNAIQEPKIRDALRTKISKERKGLEMQKILEDNIGRATSLRLFKEMNLYDLIFETPQADNLVKGTSKVYGERTDVEDAFKLAWITDWLLKINPQELSERELERADLFKPEKDPYHEMLIKEVKDSGISSHLRISIPVEPPEEVNALISFNLDQKYFAKSIPRSMFFSALLYPYRNMDTVVNGKTVSGQMWVCHNRARIPKKDSVFVLKLHGLQNRIQNVVDFVVKKERTKKDKEVAATGALIKDIHEKTGVTNWWPSIIMSSLAIELLPEYETLSQGILDDNSKAKVSKYNKFLSKAEEYGMEHIYTWKNIIEGSELMGLLGANPGFYKLPEYNERIFGWQLENPYGTKEDCKKWILENPAFAKRQHRR